MKSPQVDRVPCWYTSNLTPCCKPQAGLCAWQPEKLGLHSWCNNLPLIPREVEVWSTLKRLLSCHDLSHERLSLLDQRQTVQGNWSHRASLYLAIYIALKFIREIRGASWIRWLANVHSGAELQLWSQQWSKMGTGRFPAQNVKQCRKRRETLAQ